MKNLYLDLYFTFFKIGGFTIGGGYVMLPMIQREVVDVKKWATEDEVINYFALGQSIPGVIAINTSTMIGYKTKGLKGAICSTLGMVTPSLIIIMIIAAFFTKFQDIPVVQSAFSGIRAAVVATIIMAVIRIGKKSIQDLFGVCLCVLAFLIAIVFDVSPALIIVVAAILGIVKNYKTIQSHK